MKLAKLIAIAVIASILTQSSVFAQETPVPAVVPTVEAPAAEKSAEKSSELRNAVVPVPEKKYSIGPAIQFGGGGTSFGLTGKYPISNQFSVRPAIFFGYQPTVTGSNITNGRKDSFGLGGVFTSAQGDTIANSVGKGVAFGAAVTYDIKSPDGKITGYVGPRLLAGIASGSGSLVDNGSSVAFKIDTTEYNIGLTAGADYAITPELTAGFNATYNFYRSLKIGQLDTQSTGSGGNFNFGINTTYNF
jgi:opacity protein-like surface antigen